MYLEAPIVTTTLLERSTDICSDNKVNSQPQITVYLHPEYTDMV
jgi:hypothetical protein